MYINSKIRKKDLVQYEGIIPPTYMEQLRANKFYAGMVSDIVGDEKTDLAIYIAYSFDEWVELVWVGYLKKDILPVVQSKLLRYVTRVEKKRYGNTAKGVFFEMHATEVDDIALFKHTMMMSGFETKETLDNVYELKLEQVGEKEQKSLAKFAKMLKCITVSSADEALREKLDAMIQEDSRPVPVGMYVKWDDYLVDDSLICMKDGKPCGLLLLSKKGDSIIIECAYVTDKLALSSMLGWAYFMLRKKYGDSQKLLIPVVLEKTGLIVERLVPDAVREKQLEGIMYF